MRSLTWKLTLFVIGVSLLSIAIVFLLARWITVREFDRLVMAQTRSDVIDRATTDYRQTGGGKALSMPCRDQGARARRRHPQDKRRRAPLPFLTNRGVSSYRLGALTWAPVIYRWAPKNVSHCCWVINPSGH